jgi:tRNA threonylcarbamoyladenosine modification (KEOPS) complex  Pcc1 subunit
MSVKELRKITVNIPFRNENIALIVYQSILPETTNRKSVRGQVKAEIRSNKVILTFYSRKTTTSNHKNFSKNRSFFNFF